MKHVSLAGMLVAASALAIPVQAQLHTNEGKQYLLSQAPDLSQEFLDLSNHYFSPTRSRGSTPPPEPALSSGRATS